MNNRFQNHHRTPKYKNEWITPPEIIEALGPFDLDPCAPTVSPWITAKVKHSIPELLGHNGFDRPWKGRVWLNPPYSQAAKWMKKLSIHGNGIALIFARTETKYFFESIWNKADGLLFLKGRLHFYHTNGTRSKYNSGAPSVLVAYGKNNASILKSCILEGKYISL